MNSYTDVILLQIARGNTRPWAIASGTGFDEKYVNKKLRSLELAGIVQRTRDFKGNTWGLRLDSAAAKKAIEKARQENEILASRKLEGQRYQNPPLTPLEQLIEDSLDRVPWTLMAMMEGG